MFSGKTTELMKRIEVKERSGRNVLAVKSMIDNRFAKTEDYRSFIVSHSGGKKVNCPQLCTAEIAFHRNAFLFRGYVW